MNSICLNVNITQACKIKLKGWYSTSSTVIKAALQNYKVYSNNNHIKYIFKTHATGSRMWICSIRLHTFAYYLLKPLIWSPIDLTKFIFRPRQSFFEMGSRIFLSNSQSCFHWSCFINTPNSRTNIKIWRQFWTYSLPVWQEAIAFLSPNSLPL